MDLSSDFAGKRDDSEKLPHSSGMGMHPYRCEKYGAFDAALEPLPLAQRVNTIFTNIPTNHVNREYQIYYTTPRQCN